MNKNKNFEQMTPEILVSSELKSRLGIAPDAKLGCFDLDCAILMHKEPMTSKEKIELAASLVDCAALLLEETDEEDCMCDGCTEDCPSMDHVIWNELSLPVEFLHQAGIPEGAPLSAEIAKDGSIVIRAEEEAPGTQELTPDMIGLMRDVIFRGMLTALADLDAEAGNDR